MVFVDFIHFVLFCFSVFSISPMRYWMSYTTKHALYIMHHKLYSRIIIIIIIIIIVIMSHYTLWCLMRQQSLSTSACPEPASSMSPKSTVWLSSRAQLFFIKVFSVFLSCSFRLASSEVSNPNMQNVPLSPSTLLIYNNNNNNNINNNSNSNNNNNKTI